MLYEVAEFVTGNGKSPFAEWIQDIAKFDKLRMLQRIDRLKHGNFGDYKSVGDGVYELRFKFGSGYRIYYGIMDDRIVLLLCGGDKDSQRKDIESAKDYWRTHNERQNS